MHLNSPLPPLDLHVPTIQISNPQKCTPFEGLRSSTPCKVPKASISPTKGPPTKLQHSPLKQRPGWHVKRPRSRSSFSSKRSSILRHHLPLRSRKQWENPWQVIKMWTKQKKQAASKGNVKQTQNEWTKNTFIYFISIHFRFKTPIFW